MASTMVLKIRRENGPPCVTPPSIPERLPVTTSGATDQYRVVPEEADHPQHLGDHAASLQNIEAPSPGHCIVRLAQIDEHAIQWHLFDVCQLLRQLHLCCRCPRASPGEEPVEAILIVEY